MGTTTHTLAAAAAAAKSTSSSSSLLLIVLVFAVLMIFMFRSQSRRKRAAQNTQSQVMNGSRVRTVHGIYGTVVDGDDRNVMLEIAPGVRIKMLRQAIAAVVPDDEPDGVRQTVPDFDTSTDQSQSNPDDRSDLNI
jgi:preprotein translocase subunit YajC